MTAERRKPARAPVTYPAPKFGPTSEYGDCEAANCALDARTTCPVCAGHHCRRHHAHETHAATHGSGSADQPGFVTEREDWSAD